MRERKRAIFPADYWFLGVFRHMVWVFGLVLDIIGKDKALVLGEDFCACTSGSAPIFLADFWFFSSYGMGVWTRSGFNK